MGIGNFYFSDQQDAIGKFELGITNPVYPLLVRLCITVFLPMASGNNVSRRMQRKLTTRFACIQTVNENGERGVQFL